MKRERKEARDEKRTRRTEKEIELVREKRKGARIRGIRETSEWRH